MTTAQTTLPHIMSTSFPCCFHLSPPYPLSISFPLASTPPISFSPLSYSPPLSHRLSTLSLPSLPYPLSSISHLSPSFYHHSFIPSHPSRSFPHFSLIPLPCLTLPSLPYCSHIRLPSNSCPSFILPLPSSCHPFQGHHPSFVRPLLYTLFLLSHANLHGAADINHTTEKSCHCVLCPPASIHGALQSYEAVITEVLQLQCLTVHWSVRVRHNSLYCCPSQS